MEFETIDDLYKRVIPALRTKVVELNKLGIKNITEKDIFRFLSIEKWKNSIDLSLSEIVNDILNCSVDELIGRQICKKIQ